MPYFTGKGYGVSELTDLSDRPLLTYQGPNDKKPILLSDRIAVSFDPTIPQVVDAGALHTPRLDDTLSKKIKEVVGGTADDELDHKIPLELGGSNMLANLQLQPGKTGGPSALSDTVETELAARVAAGQISLQFAWQAIAQQKGFVLGEEFETGVQFTFAAVLPQIIALISKIPSAVTSGEARKVSADTQAQIDTNQKILNGNPVNIKARTNLINAQIAAVAEKGNVSAEEAGGVVRIMNEAYMGTSGLDKREVLSTLTVLEQRLLKVSTHAPEFLGVEATTVIKILEGTSVAVTAAVIAGAIAIIIGTIVVGPEALMASGVGFALNSVATAFGLSSILGLGVAATTLAGMITGLSFLMGFLIKENYDNGVLAVTQQITSLKDALGIEKILGTGFQMAAATAKVAKGTSVPAGGGAYGGGGGGRISAPPIGQEVNITIANMPTAHLVIPKGTLTQITSQKDLQDAISEKLAEFFNDFAGRLTYSIIKRPYVVAAGGRIITPNPPFFNVEHVGVKKTTEKQVQNRIVILQIAYASSVRGIIKIDEIPLDYSIADNVITPEPAAETGEIPVTVTTQKVALAVPKGGAVTPTIPSAGTAQAMPTPTATPPTAPPAPPFAPPQPAPAPVTPTIPVPPARNPKGPFQFQDVVWVDTPAGLHIRNDPSTGGTILASVPYRENLTVMNSQAFVKDGFTWYQVLWKYTQGWAAGEYLSLNRPA